ncbi:DUF2950 family protein [bacterium]|nr:DUF2950 family protein [bacterium]
MKLRNLLASAATFAILGGLGWAQAPTCFKTPEEAVKALAQAVGSDSEESMLSLFGSGLKPLMDPTPEGRKESRRMLALLLKERWNLASLPEGRKLLRLGQEGWPFPVTLVKGAGGWHFDSESGVEEILNRLVGRNELATLETCSCIMLAQEEYRRQDRDDDGVREYAGSIPSSAGKHDGLYWEVPGSDWPSPMQVAMKDSWKYAEERIKGTPWFGYRYRLLLGQGASAPGGARSYLINGNQVTGWALVAYPATYGSSGIMTFLCSQDGVIYQKDLGPESVQQAEALSVFDPSQGWTQVTPPGK